MIINNKLQMWKWSWNILRQSQEKLRETMKKLKPDSLSPDQVSNTGLPKYKTAEIISQLRRSVVPTFSGL